MRDVAPGQVDLSRVAQGEARKTLNDAMAALRAEADRIAEAAGIPDGIHGLTRAELLGRMSWVPSMARQYLVSATQTLAQRAISEQFRSQPATPQQHFPQVVAEREDVDVPLVSTDPAPAAPEQDLNYAMDLSMVPGIPPQALSALQQGGYVQLVDVMDVPDEHLLKINGIGPGTLQAIQGAISRAAANVAPEATT